MCCLRNTLSTLVYLYNSAAGKTPENEGAPSTGIGQHNNASPGRAISAPVSVVQYLTDGWINKKR